MKTPRQRERAGLTGRPRLAVEDRHASEERERDVARRETDPPADDRVTHLVEHERRDEPTGGDDSRRHVRDQATSRRRRRKHGIGERPRTEPDGEQTRNVRPHRDSDRGDAAGGA